MSEEEAVKKRWYVVQAYSQYEARVKKTLLEYIKMHNMEDYFGQVLVPTEEVVEMRAGQKRKSERKFFPGYVLDWNFRINKWLHTTKLRSPNSEVQ